MLPRSYLSFAGFIAIIAGTYCPLLRPFHLFNWDLYGLNKPYAIVVFIVAVAGLAAVIIKSTAIVKVSSWLSLALVVLVFIAAIMKVNTTFTFIPFKGISAGLAHLIKFRWGWSILFAGAIAAVIGANSRTQTIQNQRV